MSSSRNSRQVLTGATAAITVLAVLAVGAVSAAAQAPVPAQRTPGPLPVQITGATRVEYDEATGVWRVEGAPVTVTRGQTVMRAQRGRFDERARIVTVEGGVDVVEPGLSLRADAAELRLSDERIRARGNVRLVSTREGQSATLVAPEAEGSLATRRFAATGGVSITRGEWTVTGRRVDYDDTDQVAVISGDPEVRFKDGVMTAETVTVWVAKEQARGEGTIRLRRGDLTGSGRRVDMRLREQLATLSGAARVERGRDRLEAEEIEVELDRSRATARGAPRLTITPP
ncbi:MAG TPA: LptA/OstA family protein [bacterium]|nr:LptA/OstA family protein [bacterium]